MAENQIHVTLPSVVLLETAKMKSGSIQKLAKQMLDHGFGSRSSEHLLDVIITKNLSEEMFDIEDILGTNLSLTPQGILEANRLLGDLRYSVNGGYAVSSLLKMKSITAYTAMLLYLEKSPTPVTVYDIAPILELSKRDTQSLISRAHIHSHSFVVPGKTSHKQPAEHRLDRLGKVRIELWRKWVESKILGIVKTK